MCDFGRSFTNTHLSCPLTGQLQEEANMGVESISPQSAEYFPIPYFVCPHGAALPYGSWGCHHAVPQTEWFR